MTGDDGKEMEVRFAEIFEMIIAGTDRIAVTIDVQAQNAGAGLQPMGATATERLVPRAAVGRRGLTARSRLLGLAPTRRSRAGQDRPAPHRVGRRRAAAVRR